MQKHRDINLADKPTSSAILEGFEERLPRYTSYPAAPHFSAIDSKTHKHWLRNVPKGEPLSLYIHVPFCKQLCWFCGCTTSVANSYKSVSRFMDTLVQEIQLVGNMLANGKKPAISHIHFGGGSPTLLSSLDFDRLMGVINYQFNIAKGAEIAIEIDPRTLSVDKIKQYALHGINRASIGVQDFDEKVQNAINREQSEDMIFSSFEDLRDNGIKNINMDLIFGLPKQTVSSVISTALKAVKLNPSRISLFPYAHVPWMKRHQLLIKEGDLPEKEVRLEMASVMREIFIEAGYQAIGMDHFAKADDSLIEAQTNKRMRRNFQGYSDDKANTLIGFGPSAISKLPDGYVQNSPNIKTYHSVIWRDELPSEKGHAFSKEDKIFGSVIEELMCHYSVDLNDVAHKYNANIDIFRPALEKIMEIKGLAESGILHIDGDKISINSENPTLVRAVASRFDQYLVPKTEQTDNPMQYSKLA